MHNSKRVNLSSHNLKSTSFKIGNRQGNNSSSEKEHSPCFGVELHSDPSLNGVLVPFGNEMQAHGEKMEIEHNNPSQSVNKNKSHDSLMTLGKREH